MSITSHLPGDSPCPDHSLYVDRRRGGEERWSLGPPRDHAVRIPDDLLSTPFFFGGRDPRGQLHYRATAFRISMKSPTGRVLGAFCLVTARHNVERAIEEYGNVWVRANTDEGGARDIEITADWAYPDNPASDVAVVPFDILEDLSALPVPTGWFVTDEIVESRRIGIGEELVVIGLFSRHVGTNRNLPIVRSGNLASMPIEPLVDEDTGRDYHAYLAEVRSIGGLSGSPVFAALNPATRIQLPRDGPVVLGQMFYLLGLIRGHWPHDHERDFGQAEKEQLNSGIAIVTPIADVLPVLERERFVRYNEEFTKHLREEEEGKPTKDWVGEPPPPGDPEDDQLTRGEFLGALGKIKKGPEAG